MSKTTAARGLPIKAGGGNCKWKLCSAKARNTGASSGCTAWSKRLQNACNISGTQRPSPFMIRLLQPVDRRREADVPRLQLQRQELRVVARLVQIAAVEPERLLLRRLPHVALLALPRARVLGRAG